MKPFLKWPGGKYRLSKRICSKLSQGQRLIEPFTGSAAVFLNTDYDEYLLADNNPDLINLYQQLVKEGHSFIDYCQSLFTRANNSEKKYYLLRQEFNFTDHTRRKSALFLYLNRHCYNGLCRYNSSGEFNTPFGRYDKPYFPKKEMENFITAAGNTTFMHAGFLQSMKLARKGDTVYCDPPYAPLTATAYFTDYHTGGFKWDEQVLLAGKARKLADRGIPVVISNHNTREIRELYKEMGAKIERFQVRRSISCNGNNRAKVGELLAVFS